MSWQDEALCAQTDPDLFFPTKGGDNGQAAKRICRDCPVQSECLADALTTGELHGVRGGLTGWERYRLTREAS